MQDAEEVPQKRVKREEEKLDKPLFVIGANFGPYITNDFRDRFYEYFQKCAGVSFRDYQSFQEFNSIEKVQFAPDVVFNLPKGTIHKMGTAVISVINPSKKSGIGVYSDSYYCFLAEICKEFISRGKTPVLVGFCRPERDHIAVENIVRKLDVPERKRVQCVCYENNIDEIIEIFRNTDFVLATRFHAMILALRFSKPFFAISYDAKIENTLKDIKCTNYCKIENINHISTKHIFDCLDNVIDVENYAKRAIEQFRQLDVFLRKGKKYANNQHNNTSL